MMTKLKMELEKELGAAGGAAQSSNRNSGPIYQEKIRSQIKHLEDQMKCVVFLLMQCQIGLESCNEPSTAVILNSRPQRPAEEEEAEESEERNTLVPPPARPPPPSIFILNENDNSDEDFSDTNSTANLNRPPSNSDMNAPSTTEADQTDTSD